MTKDGAHHAPKPHVSRLGFPGKQGRGAATGRCCLAFGVAFGGGPAVRGQGRACRPTGQLAPGAGPCGRAVRGFSEHTVSPRTTGRQDLPAWLGRVTRAHRQTERASASPGAPEACGRGSRQCPHRYGLEGRGQASRGLPVTGHPQGWEPGTHGVPHAPRPSYTNSGCLSWPVPAAICPSWSHVTGSPTSATLLH